MSRKNKTEEPGAEPIADLEAIAAEDPPAMEPTQEPPPAAPPEPAPSPISKNEILVRALVLIVYGAQAYPAGAVFPMCPSAAILSAARRDIEIFSPEK